MNAAAKKIKNMRLAVLVFLLLCAAAIWSIPYMRAWWTLREAIRGKGDTDFEAASRLRKFVWGSEQYYPLVFRALRGKSISDAKKAWILENTMPYSFGKEAREYYLRLLCSDDRTVRHILAASLLLEKDDERLHDFYVSLQKEQDATMRKLGALHCFYYDSDTTSPEAVKAMAFAPEEFAYAPLAARVLYKKGLWSEFDVWMWGAKVKRYTPSSIREYVLEQKGEGR